MPRLKKIIRISILTMTVGFMLAGVSSLAPFNGPDAYAAPATKSHPANSKAAADCKPDQTPTKVGGSGPNKDKYYCKANPQQGVGQAQGQGGPTGPCSNNGCDLIEKYVNPFIRLLTIIVGLVAAASLIIGGIQYSASSGDPQKASSAKDRISKTLLGLIIYAFLYAFLNFLVPGGIFH